MRIYFHIYIERYLVFFSAHHQQSTQRTRYTADQAPRSRLTDQNHPLYIIIYLHTNTKCNVCNIATFLVDLLSYLVHLKF